MFVSMFGSALRKRAGTEKERQMLFLHHDGDLSRMHLPDISALVYRNHGQSSPYNSSKFHCNIAIAITGHGNMQYDMMSLVTG